MNNNTYGSKETYTLDDIKSIIDSHMDDEREFDFTVDKELAKEIYDYIKDEYYVSDESENPFDEDADVFSISVLFDMKGYTENNPEADIALYCGDAKGNSGKWLLGESDNIDYYFGTDISDNDIEDYFVGHKNSTWTRFNYLGDVEILDDPDYEDEYTCDQDCENCADNPDDELSDSELAECDYIDSVVNQVANLDCKDCIADKLFDLAYTFKKFGYDEARLEMREILEDDE